MSAMFFLLNVAIRNSPAYIYSDNSLTPLAFLEHQTEAYLIALLIFIARIHIASFIFMFFSAKYLTVHQYFIHKTVVLLRANNTRPAFMYYPNGKEMDQMVRNDIACNCIPLERIAFWYACI